MNAPLTGGPRVCAKTVMDTTDPDIRFDADGVCNWWHEFHAIAAQRPSPSELTRRLETELDRIRAAGRGKPYDCILGLSGGVDSSYLAHLCKAWELRPLVVHFDNGWNDELAVANIEALVGELDFRLETFVMNWPEFRDLQRAYFKASVLDLEVPTDHLIFGALFRIARKHDVKYIMSGNNFATEWLLPRAWHYAKGDAVNIGAIHDRFGERRIANLPIATAWQRLYWEKVRLIQAFEALNYLDYKKNAAKDLLAQRYGWKDYGGKHYESVFTRFYQGYILPRRYGIDKRKAHLSNLILNGEITREEALAELAKPTYDPDRQLADKRYVAKKLGWSEAEFEEILSLPPVPHEAYGTGEAQFRQVSRLSSAMRPFARAGRAVLRV